MNGKNIIKFISIITIVVFIFSYCLTNTGYYEYNLYNKRNLTNEQIKRFESDVKEGNDIDINRYLESTTIDYSNKLTQTTSNASIRLNKYLKKVLINTFHILEKLIK